MAAEFSHCEQSEAIHDFQQHGLPRCARGDDVSVQGPYAVSGQVRGVRSDVPKQPAPLLVLAWGNLSRGDDALGPLCLAALREQDSLQGQVAFLEDYQLQIEHALDLIGRQRVLLIDASLSCAAPFEVTALRAARDASHTTHALSPQALLQVFQDLQGEPPPPCTLLAIRGEAFELGERPGASALVHLQSALQWARRWLHADGD
ncbi:hydrogenase maturation protease [Rhodoferax sp.]|uniref:hydrogenase maturation protease n=1 Tax=Rhodoferax sp. TaxID=50421 RepID=UPI0019DE89D9|nr:hydrogenase maturation protease [Rhodoferax sp.]MBE0473913.1 hydrogenase maturation protease [Rhodoferax sp.]